MVVSRNKKKCRGGLNIWFLIIIIGGFILWLGVTQIEDFNLQNDPKLIELKDKLKPLFLKKHTGILEPLNNKNILNNVGLYKGDKSYTINKQKIFLCLNDQNNNYYPDYQLIFVLLHEISHSICQSVGHTEEFNKIFDVLLKEAVNMGIYDPNFEIIQDYCNYND